MPNRQHAWWICHFFSLFLFLIIYVINETLEMEEFMLHEEAVTKITFV